MPWIVWANKTPVNAGSGLGRNVSQVLHHYTASSYLKPSQFRPPSGDRPRGPATGPSWTSAPFIWCSAPIAFPRAYARLRSNVAATLTPAGKTELKSAVLIVSKFIKISQIARYALSLTPTGESCMHMLRNPSRGIAPFWPTQRSPSHLSYCKNSIIVLCSR